MAHAPVRARPPPSPCGFPSTQDNVRAFVAGTDVVKFVDESTGSWYAHLGSRGAVERYARAPGPRALRPFPRPARARARLQPTSIRVEAVVLRSLCGGEVHFQGHDCGG